MRKSLYLINPRAEVPSYWGAEVHERSGYKSAQGIADLATPTIAALAPPDWEVSICEEYVEPIDFESGADFVGLTGKITQGTRILEIAEEFRRRGTTVIIGGPYASLSPETFRGRCDVLVIGELEAMAAELFADLERGDFKAEYEAPERPDLIHSPLPRWELYPNHLALTGCVQTSRGCPFECEFCDVIQYLGRKQRHKSIDQILAELDQLHEIGYRQVFLADDNFTVYRRRAKEVLAAIAEWNAGKGHDPVALWTQVSIDAVRDLEIVELCAAAGMTFVFVGIETPNEASLKEVKKRQNVGVDLAEQVQIFYDHGIGIMAGMIVGFDNDGPDIFERQFDFAMSTPIAIFSVHALVAPEATPLHARMEESGRLSQDGPIGPPWETNIVPAGMTREQLMSGLKWLCNRLYDPANFGQRVVQMIERMGPRRGPFADVGGRTPTRPLRQVEMDGLKLIRKVMRRGPAEREMWSRIWGAMREKPGSEAVVMQALHHYAQIRCAYDEGRFWEPQLVEQAALAAIGSIPESGESLVSLGG